MQREGGLSRFGVFLELDPRYDVQGDSQTLRPEPHTRNSRQYVSGPGELPFHVSPSVPAEWESKVLDPQARNTLDVLQFDLPVEVLCRLGWFFCMGSGTF